jgi:hypothetical protein
LVGLPGARFFANLLVGFFIASSSDTLGLLVIRLLRGSCYVSSVRYEVAPCYSDQGADLGQHVRSLDTHVTDDAGKLLKFFL